MNSIKDHHIEQFIRFPGELSRHEYERVEKYISENEEARQLAKWFREFYDEFDVLSRPVVFRLSNKNVKPSYTGPMVLAAMSPEQKTSGLITKATFSSEEESTLVRVLEDRKTRELQFHVLSKFLSSEDRVLIGFGDSGVELITEKGGKLKHVKEQSLSDINWKDALLLLRLPSSTCFYNPESTYLKFTVCDECTLELAEGNCIFSTTDSGITRLLVEQGEKTRLFYHSDEAVSFSVDESQSFVIYLYR